MAALSVQRAIDGWWTLISAAVQATSNDARSWELAATPPQSRTVGISLSTAARTVLATSTSTTAAWNEAQTSATSGSLPSLRSRLTYVWAAVLRPENEKS